MSTKVIRSKAVTFPRAGNETSQQNVTSQTVHKWPLTKVVTFVTLVTLNFKLLRNRVRMGACVCACAYVKTFPNLTSQTSLTSRPSANRLQQRLSGCDVFRDVSASRKETSHPEGIA